jgi:type II secretory pathway component PulJ
MSRNRRGTSLVEMLVVVTAISLIVGATGVCLQGAYRADRRTREELSRQAALHRLAVQFRSDAHRAQAARLLAPAGQQPAGLAFAQPDGKSIEYRWQEERLERRVLDGQNRLHSDSFAVSRVRAVEWRLSAGRTVLATVVIRSASEGADAGAGKWEWHIDAAVGLR